MERKKSSLIDDFERYQKEKPPRLWGMPRLEERRREESPRRETDAKRVNRHDDAINFGKQKDISMGNGLGKLKWGKMGGKTK